MAVTIEQVEQLQKHADVSYGEAKAALEASGGDLLDAMIWLETHGKTSTVTGQYDTGGRAVPPHFSTWSSGSSGTWSREAYEKAHTKERKPGAVPPTYPKSGEGFLHRVWRWLVENRLEAVHAPSGRCIEIPIAALIALLVLAVWLVGALLLAGLVFGWHYRFAGPNLDKNQPVNDFMNGVDAVADDLRRQAKDKWNHSKRG